MNEIIEGEPAKKPFQVYRCDIDGKPDPNQRVDEYETIAEVNGHNFHLGHQWRIRVGRRYMTKQEFDTWATSQT